MHHKPISCKHLNYLLSCGHVKGHRFYSGTIKYKVYINYSGNTIAQTTYLSFLGCTTWLNMMGTMRLWPSISILAMVMCLKLLMPEWRLCNYVYMCVFVVIYKTKPMGHHKPKHVWLNSYTASQHGIHCHTLLGIYMVDKYKGPYYLKVI